METLLTEIEVYADACGLTPGTVVQRAAGLSGITWQRWQAGGSCTMRSADRIREFMAANPPKTKADAA